MKIALYISGLVLIGSCASLSHKEKIQAIKDNIHIAQPEQIITYANTITAQELKEHLYIFSSDEFQGRKTGTVGHRKAAEFLKNYYEAEGNQELGADRGDEEGKY